MSDSLWPEKTWSQAELGQHFPNAKNLQDLIAATGKLAQKEGAVVCEVIVNGIKLSEEDENKFSASTLGEIHSLHVKIEKIDALLDESLIGCREYLSRLTASIEHASNLFRSDDLVSAHKFYRTCVDGAQLFIEMIAHYKIVFENARGAMPATWQAKEKKMLSALGQILDAYKQKNYILVADMLEYDLIEVLVAWQNELANLEHNSASGTASDPSETESSTR